MIKTLRAVMLTTVATAALSMSGTAWAQYGSSLTGTVTDASGAVVPGASVTLTNEATHQTVTRQAGEGGTYNFPSLPGGKYDLSVTAKGFKVASYTAVDVPEGQPRNLDVALNTGGNTETVTVNASEVPTLQTADGSIGTTIDSQQFEKIPVYGRDPYNMLRTAPGITGDGARSGNGTAVFLPNSVGPGGSNFGIAQAENVVQISANGQRMSDNNFLLDGVSVNSLGYGGGAVVTPNIEAIGSINVVSTSFSAEDGRNSGAQIRTVTKSGTNRFHGGVNFQYDEPGLNAYNKYGGPSGQKPLRVQTKNRDIAASLGGPIVPNKLFGFVSFERFQLQNKSYTSQYVDTAQFRASIHTLRPNSIADRIANAPGTTPRILTVLTQTCPNGTPGVSCNVVSGGLDVGSPSGAQGTYLANGVFGGGFDGVPDVQYVQTFAPGAADGKQFNGRVDFTVSPKDTVAATFYLTKLHNATQGSQTRPNQDVLFNPINTAATLIYLHTFNPSLLNEFRANFTRFFEDGVKDGIDGGSNFGIPYINIQGEPFASQNNIQYGINQSPTTPARFAENQYEIRDTITKLFGSHTLKIGFEARLEQDNTDQLGGSRPVYAVNGLFNFFNDAPIYEGIYANPATGGPAVSARYLHDHYYAVFVQHDWKATPELTINTGLRWEYFEPIYNKGMQINYPTLGAAGSELSGAALTPRNHLYNAQYGNVSPKFGFAYTPTALHNKTVLRGGFAMAYNRLNDVLFDPALEDGPGIFNYGLCCATSAATLASSGITYQLGTSNAPNSYAPNSALKTAINAKGLPSSGLQVEAYGADPKLKTPYSYLFSLEVQQDLGKQFVLSVGYQGSTGRHYTRLVNQNFIYSNTNSPFYALYIAKSDSNQYYNALNVHAQKHYKAGISLDATYTYSKSMDQITNGDGANGNANQTYPYNNDRELGPSDFDVKHRVVASGTYDLHPYHGDNALLALAANGWEINGIFTAHTGFPWTPVTYLINGLPLASNANVISPIRPNSYTGHYSATCDADAFRNGTTVSGSFGVVSNGTNLPGMGRNSFRGPCYQQIDAGVAKDFSLNKWLGEGSGLRLQAQAFNVFNKLNYTPFGFASTSTVVDSGVVQQTTSASQNPSNLPVGTIYHPTGSTFQKPVSASAGRVVELSARIRF